MTILLIAVIPLAGTIWDSLFRLSLRFENAPRPFIGLDNYISALSDDAWYNALSVTGLVAGVSVAAELVLGMIIALLINRNFRGAGHRAGLGAGAVGADDGGLGEDVGLDLRRAVRRRQRPA